MDRYSLPVSATLFSLYCFVDDYEDICCDEFGLLILTDYDRK